MKAYIRKEPPPPPPPKVVVLEMTEKEAEVLCALVGGIRLSNEYSDAARTVSGIFEWLNSELSERELSFSDLFKGSVEVR